MAKATRPISELETYKNLPVYKIQSLYADQSQQKSVNPDGFQSTLHWWLRTLGSYVTQGWQTDSDVLVLHAGPDLPLTFRFEGVGRPIGLHSIISELRDSQKIIPLDRFMNSPQSIYDQGSILYRFASLTLGRPLWWALQRLNIVESENTRIHESEASRWKDVKGSYVLVQSLEKAADIVLRRQRNGTGTSLADSLYDFETFKSEYGNVGAVFPDVALSTTDLRVLIKFLSRDRNVVATNENVIKFMDYEPDMALRIITAVDKGVLELKLALQGLEKQVEDIQKKIQSRTEQASASLKEKRKDIAMHHLKSRKQYEEVLKHRLKSLDTLQSTMIEVETAAGNIEIMKQYESSTATLREILSHPSLQHDKIEETMDAMAEASAQHKEVDEMIRQGGDMALAEADIDDSDLESELAKMVEEVKKEEEEKERDEKEKAEKEKAEQGTKENERMEGVVASIPPITKELIGENVQMREQASTPAVEASEQRTTNLTPQSTEQDLELQPQHA